MELGPVFFVKAPRRTSFLRSINTVIPSADLGDMQALLAGKELDASLSLGLSQLLLRNIKKKGGGALHVKDAQK